MDYCKVMHPGGAREVTVAAFGVRILVGRQPALRTDTSPSTRPARARYLSPWLSAAICITGGAAVVRASVRVKCAEYGDRNAVTVGR